MIWVDDIFFCEFVDRGEDVSNLFVFIEVIEVVNDGIFDIKIILVGLSKMKLFGLINFIIEIDLVIDFINWEVFIV